MRCHTGGNLPLSARGPSGVLRHVLARGVQGRGAMVRVAKFSSMSACSGLSMARYLYDNDV